MIPSEVDEFDAAFAAAMGAPAPPAERLIGLEHEYRVSISGEQLDFREFIHRLPVEGKRLDPGDINAYRLTSGMALTCDETEAEVVSPPVVVEPGFTGAVEGWADAGRGLLAGLLPPGVSVEGYSTHLSVAMPDQITDAASELYAHTFAPALALMLEHRDSHGIYVRPRPGRLELCGEYVDGPRLGSVAAFAAGSAAACALMVTGELSGAAPPRIDVAFLPGKERYGLRVLRDAYGRDLYRKGRTTVLKLESGGTIRAQEVLELCWEAARASLLASASPQDLDVAGKMVSGGLPLGVEEERPSVATRAHARPRRSPLGELLAVRKRPTFLVAPAAATWDFTVFRVEGAQRLAYATVPRCDLERFLGRLDAGRLDGILAAYLDSPPRGRVLASRAQVESPGLYDSLGNPAQLLPEEREPAGWSEPGGARAGKAAASDARPSKRPAAKGRPGKVVALPPLPTPSPRPETPAQPIAGGGGIPWLAVAAAAIVAVVGVAIAAGPILTGGDSPNTEATPTPGFQAAATSTAVPTASPTVTATATATPTAKVDSAAASPSAAAVPGAATATPTATATAKATEPATATAAPTATKFATETPRPTATPTLTPTPTPAKAATIPPPPPTPCKGGAAGCP